MASDLRARLEDHDHEYSDPAHCQACALQAWRNEWKRADHWMAESQRLLIELATERSAREAAERERDKYKAVASAHACFAAWEEATADAEAFHARLVAAERRLDEIPIAWIQERLIEIADVEAIDSPDDTDAKLLRYAADVISHLAAALAAKDQA